MKKLGKKLMAKNETLEAYSCSCGCVCPCVHASVSFSNYASSHNHEVAAGYSK